jgi:APA family basic amino acid/polyamine antiporter
VLSIIVIYLLVNLALFYVLPLSRIAGDKLAIGTAAQKIFGSYGDTVIRALTIISMLSAINAFHLMATRVLFSMSCDRLCSGKAERVNAGGTPTVALFVSATVAVLFILSGTFEKVIAILAFFFVANYTISFISVFVLRHREPALTRPYRAWGYPWTTGLALLCSVAFLVGAVASDVANNTRDSLYALLLLALSYPAYLLLRKLSRR